MKMLLASSLDTLIPDAACLGNLSWNAIDVQQNQRETQKDWEF
jgi:hypothetical protein